VVERGADPVEIAAHMGHTSTRMTLDVYARLFDDRQGRLQTSWTGRSGM
jgi:integrase